MLFIARGGERTGLGHFARSQKLVETARVRGHEAELLCLLDGSRSPAVTGARPIADEEELLSVLAGRAADVIVVDMLGVKGPLAQTLKGASVPVVSLSPVAPDADWPSLVILRSAPDRRETRAPHLVAMEFAVLGQSATRISEAVFSRALDSGVRRIAVCFGGADPSDDTLATVRALAADIDAELDVFIGPAYPHDQAPLELAAGAGGATAKVYRGDARLWDRLSQSSLLVGGGGLLAYESAYCGMPSVHLVPRGIRREMLAPLASAGAIRVVDRDANDPYSRVCALVKALDPETLGEMRRVALSMPLGNGHVRCLEAIESLVS